MDGTAGTKPLCFQRSPSVGSRLFHAILPHCGTNFGNKKGVIIFEKFLRSDEEKEREIDEILGLLKDLNFLEERRRERDEDCLAKRRAAAAEVGGSQAELAARLPSLDDAILKADRRKQEAEKELTSAKAALVRAHHDRRVASFECDHVVSRSEAILRETAPAEIDAFIHEVNGHFHRRKRASKLAWIVVSHVFRQRSNGQRTGRNSHGHHCLRRGVEISSWNRR